MIPENQNIDDGERSQKSSSQTSKDAHQSYKISKTDSYSDQVGKFKYIKTITNLLADRKVGLSQTIGPSATQLPSLSEAIGKIASRLDAMPEKQTNVDQTLKNLVTTTTDGTGMSSKIANRFDESQQDTSSGMGQPIETQRNESESSLALSNAVPARSRILEPIANVGVNSQELIQNSVLSRNDQRFTSSNTSGNAKQNPPRISSTINTGETPNTDNTGSNFSRYISNNSSIPISQAVNTSHPSQIQTTGTDARPNFSRSGNGDASSVQSASLTIPFVDQSHQSPDAQKATTSLTSQPKVEVLRVGVGVSGLSNAHEQRGEMEENESSNNLVRNPFSSDLRNQSMSVPPSLDTEASSGGLNNSLSDFGHGAHGVSPGSEEGCSVDLSKTNELLQQLVDAVRSQAGSSLPIRSPSVYSER